MLFGRLFDAIATRCGPQIQAAVERTYTARLSEDRKEVREMIGEMEDVLEKFSRVVARQAKRRTRAMQAVLDEDEQPRAAQEAPVQADPLPDDVRARKALLRQRLAAGGLRVPRGSDE